MLLMWIEEPNPENLHTVVIRQVRAEDLKRVVALLRQHVPNVVVLTDNSKPGRPASNVTHFGLYCEQCGTWWSESSGRICFYPASELAHAHLNDSEKHSRYSPVHKWKVQEFGKEEHVEQGNLPNGTTICPVLAAKIREMHD